MKKLIVFCMLLLWPVHGLARPVSYPGGWTVMQMNDVHRNNLYVHYSPTAKHSVGYVGEYRRTLDWQFHGVQVNYLAKRWNKPKSQANFYLKTGAGIGIQDPDGLPDLTEPAAFIGAALDWEDQRYFISYENRAYFAGDIEQSFQQKFRAGIAPYIGSYGDLHIWFMVQLDHTPDVENKLTVTPLVRVFKGVFLGEFGISHRGDILANWIIRF